ncbi:MAG: hypothetical protein LQ350_008592, partial [Teloschistes chrysophthalmus]
MALTVDREGPSRNWMRLDPDHLDRKLVALGLYQNTPEPALICRQCKYALKPSAAAVSKHLWEKHQISKDARKGLVPFVKSLTLPDPNQLPLRRDASLPHPHLAVQQGMACRRCTFRSTSGDLVRRHLSSVHGIKNNRQTWLRDDVRDRLSLQSWTQNGQRQYWIVANEDQTGLASTAADATYSPRRRRRVAELHEDQYRRITADAQSRSTTDLGLDDLASVSNWMRRTNWAATFAGADRLLLLLLTEKPAANGHRLLLGLYGTTEVYSSIDDERRLVAIGKAVDHFLDRCEDTARNTDHSLRCWLRSQVPGHSYKAPFELLGRTRTMIRYRGYWKRLIYFVFRLYRLDDVYRDSLHAQLSCKQRKAVEEVWTTLQSDFTASRSNTGIEDPSLNPPRYRATARSNSSSDSCSSLDVEVDPSGVTLAAQRFTRALSKLPSTLGPLDEVDELDQISSSFDESSLDTESSSADSDEARDSDETKESDHVTIPMQVARERSQGIIPALLKCTSLSLLANDVGAAPSGSTTTPTTQEEEEQLADLIGRLSVFFCMEEFTDSRSSSTMIVYFSGILGFSPSGTTFERPRNYTPKLSALIYCIRLCLLEASLPRFAHPLIGWKVRAPSGNLKRLNRVRERFMCLGCQAPMGELLSLRSYGRAISRSDGPSFRVQWSNDSETVMWNGAKLSMKHFRQLGHHAVQTATTLIARLMYGVRPTIRLGSIRDSISNVAQGYSFIQDPANGLATAYLDLSTRACLDPLDGLMLSERWNYPAVHRYLKEEADLLVQVMLIMYLRGGQAPRLTELFSIECYNGSSTSRGVYIHAGTIVYVTRHSKARRSTNQEFQIARYLSHGDSELVAQYLIYVRPFAEMLRRECLGGTDGRRLLFSSSETPEQAWKTVVLTKALKKLSVDICGISIGVQVYRQLSIAVTEKYIKQISRPFNRYDDKSSHADLDVAFAWQSGHRPLQRGTTYGIDSAFPDSLQPALLRIYHWVSKEWHSFLRIDRHSQATSRSQQVRTPGSRHRGDFRDSKVIRDQTLDTTPETQPSIPSCYRSRTDTYHDDSLSETDRRYGILTSATRSQDSSFGGEPPTSMSSSRRSAKKVRRRIRWIARDSEVEAGSSDVSPAASVPQSTKEQNVAKRKPSHSDSLFNPRSRKIRRGNVTSTIGFDRRQRSSSYETNRSKRSTGPNVSVKDMDFIDSILERTYDDTPKGSADVHTRSLSKFSTDIIDRRMDGLKSHPKQMREQAVNGNPASKFPDHGLLESNMTTFDVSLDSLETTIQNVQRDRTVGNRRSPKKVNSLEECLSWWERKCAYCIGKGLKSAGIEHEIRFCPNGGREQCFKGLGESIYLEGIFVRVGCSQCALPEDRCGAWKQSDSQRWVREKNGRCRWGSVVYDTIIALFHSGVEEFYLDIYETIQDEGEPDYDRLDEESIAIWLTRPTKEENTTGSAEIIEIFKAWTKTARVSCQQMFPAQHGSNYFRVGPLTLAEDDEAVPIDAATKARQRVRDAQQALERRTIREVEDRREGTEFVPWLERMGWPTYLRGLDRQVLIGLVKTPDTEEEPLVAM